MYDFENFHTSKAVPYRVSLDRLIKIAARYNPDLTTDRGHKLKNDNNNFERTDCNKKFLDWIITLQGELKNK